MIVRRLLPFVPVLFLIFAASCSIFQGNDLSSGYFSADLRDEANMGFIDPVPGDGKGGWFDGGPAEDLRYFLVNHASGEKLPAQIIFKGTPFRIIDPDSNHGKCMIVFGSETQPKVQKRSTLPVRVGRRASALRFLHADGWGKNGCIVAECELVYEDGTKAFFSLKNGDNISDWYFPKQIPHAELAWNGFSEHASSCGLYMTEWKLPYPEKVIRSLAIRGTGKRMYGLLALTFVEKNALPAGPDTLLPGLPPNAERKDAAPAAEEVNPNHFPEYTQTLDVIFKNIYDARDAELIPEPLPGKKRFAFTTRWDDCSAKHLRHAQLMHKYGFRGSFILNAFNQNYVKSTALPFLKLGHAAGNHSGRHFHFSKMTKNEVYENVALQQVLIESSLNTISVSFTFPFGMGYPDAEHAFLIGRVLNSSGIYCSPFTRESNGAVMGLSPRRMFSTYLFHANDRRPDAALFEHGRIWAERLSLNNPETPRITYGLHTMMDDKGFEQLEEIYKNYAGRKEYWYCNDNEYGSYRYSFYNADPKKTLQGGPAARFELRRYSPAFLGAETPFEISFTKDPVSVRLYGIPLKRTAWGTYVLPHGPGKKLPSKIACITRGSESPDIPGVLLDLQFIAGKNALKLSFKNVSSKMIRDVRFTVLVPPHWKQMKHDFDLERLAQGGAFIRELRLGVEDLRPAYQGKHHSFVCKADFSLDGKTYRLYRILRIKNF